MLCCDRRVRRGEVTAGGGTMGSVIVSVTEARATFPALLERAAAGQEVIVTRNGKPLARILPVGPEPVGREPGVLGWEPGSHDPAIFAPMTDESMAAEGWP